MFLLIRTLSDWFWNLSPIILPGGLVLAMWISLSHRGEFALSWQEKLLRLMIFVGVVLLFSFFSSPDSDASLIDGTILQSEARCPNGGRVLGVVLIE